MPVHKTYAAPDARPLPGATLLIVVGAHLAAEQFDRPIAYRLATQIKNHAATLPRADIGAAPLVCSDLWWLNDAALREKPTLSIGGPEVNALTAYLADKLPTVFAVDGALAVQFDLEGSDPLAACWGADPARTAAATEIFVEKYLDAFLRSA